MKELRYDIGPRTAQSFIFIPNTENKTITSVFKGGESPESLAASLFRCPTLIASAKVTALPPLPRWGDSDSSAGVGRG